MNLPDHLRQAGNKSWTQLPPLGLPCLPLLGTAGLTLAGEAPALPATLSQLEQLALAVPSYQPYSSWLMSHLSKGDTVR